MNVLLDTSVWINHFKNDDPQVVHLLENQLVVVHEYVIAELACGSPKNRNDTLRYLGDMPKLASITDDELMSFIDLRKLYSHCVGLVNVQLLGSVVVEGGAVLWTRDKRLGAVAFELGVGYGGK